MPVSPQTRQAQQQHDPAVEKRCTKCRMYKPYSDFSPNKNKLDGTASWCKKCTHKCTRDISQSTPQRRMWNSSKTNSATNGIEHTITLDDIPVPEICKYLGIKIDYRKASERGRLRSFDAPSIDRIDSKQGYIPGNIQVISDLANRMKQDATIDQLIAFAEGVLRAHT